MSSLDEVAVKNFRDYVRIPSVHPEVDYTGCVKFLTALAENIRLPYRVVYVKPAKPVVIMTWLGAEPTLPTILLNSHMDVVAVQVDKWTYDPFGAELTADGKIYGRGTQDMKCVGIMYLEAIRRLKLKGAVCRRTVNVIFVPDEEIGGMEGMKLFVKTPEFKEMNVIASFDEGVPTKRDDFIVFSGEKCCWQFDIRCKGRAGHGSLLLEDTPGEKIAHILNKAYEFRETQKKLLESDLSIKNEGLMTSLNCTKIKGGVQNNVIPCEMTATFDCRVATSQCLKEFEEMLRGWCDEAGPGCSIEYRQKDDKTPVTDIEDDEKNPFWKAFREAVEDMGHKLRPMVCMGATDSRYLRMEGVKAFNFSPLERVEWRVHDNDEYLKVDDFLKGIGIYCEIIEKVANVL